MKFFLILCFFFIQTSFLTYGQTDCGCSAALRYDVFRLKKDSYSEMLFARDINTENYKDLRLKAGGNLSIFGIEVGANGENIQKIKDTYNEKLRTLNISREITDYESITTSPLAYDAYKTCMADCIKKNSKGLDAYVVSENGNQIVIDLYYGGEARSTALPVQYQLYGKMKNIAIKSNGWKTIYINRQSKESLDIVFSSDQYSSKPIHINEYKPITGNFLVTYDEDVEIPGPEIGQTVTTIHEENKSCGIYADAYYKVDAQLVAALPKVPDGYYAWKESCAQNFMATRIGLKISAPTGYQIRISENNCIGGCGWTEDGHFLVNTPTTALYTAKAYGPPATFTLRAKTYKIETYSRERFSFSTTSSISLTVPPNTKNTFVNFKDKKLELGTSNNLLRFEGPVRISQGGWKIYDYLILIPPKI